MRKNFGKLKQLGKVLASVAIASTLCIQTASAQEQVQDTVAEGYLNNILTVVNELPTFLAKLPTLAITLLASDNLSSDPVNWSTNWSNEQSWLATLGSDAMNNEASQAALQTSLLTSFFGAANISSGTPQNLNDLSYTTLLGTPLLSPDPRSGANASLNYLTNASSLGITYPIPAAGWRGTQEAQKNYSQFYNTFTSIQTYNAYVLSRLYQDSQTMSSDTSLRKQLITQSTNSAWFTSVITNDLGWVLRQILLYSSQNYVLMDQLVQTQKQMSATLAMTNSLLIANSGFQANTLLSKAQGSGG